MGIGDYIAQDNPKRTMSFLQDMRAACRELCDKPMRYPVLDEYDAQVLRRRPFGHYGIFYSVQGRSVVIVRIVHAAMDLKSALA